MKIESAMAELRLCLRMYLEQTGMSQREFCKLAHVDRNVLCQIMKGEKVNLTLETLIKLVNQAGVRVWIM